MGNWNPPKVNPFAGLFGQKTQPKPAEPPRRVSMRAMKAVDLKKLSADDVLEVDEFSLAQQAQDEGQDFDRDEARENARELAKKAAKDPAAQKQLKEQARAKPKSDMPSLKPESYGAPAPSRMGPSQGISNVPQKLPPRPVDPKFSALVALNSANDPGVFFVDDSQREGHQEEQEDPELREAVEECIRLLFGVSGIHHVGPGKNDKGEPVIVVAACDGFTQESMRAVPEKVHRFATLLALPFDLVPLRRLR